ncbi:GSCOCG00002518001-RA-CDS [Cotesia congregata]|nr:GSCOCG00002518001-RA-CDS [Cotesia congregata]
MCSGTGSLSSSLNGTSRSILSARCGSLASVRLVSSLSLNSAPGGNSPTPVLTNTSRLFCNSSAVGSTETFLPAYSDFSDLTKMSFMSKSSSSEVSEGGSLIQVAIGSSSSLQNSPQIQAAA